MSRNISESIKKRIAGKQEFKCANNPDVELVGIVGFMCPLWARSGAGNFNEAGYEIDHIIEHSITYDNNEKNLQALCLMCHTVKTKRFMNNRKNREISSDSSSSSSEDTSELSSDSVHSNTDTPKDFSGMRNPKYSYHRCKRCKDPFYTSTALKIHIKKQKKCERQKTSDKILAPCICQCGKELSTPQKLKHHKQICRVCILNINNVEDNSTKNIINNKSITINNNTKVLIYKKKSQKKKLKYISSSSSETESESEISSESSNSFVEKNKYEKKYKK